MHLIFDIKTLLLTATLVNLLIAGLLTFYWKREETYPGFGFWALSHGLGGAFYLLYALRGTISDFSSIILANTLVVLFGNLRLEGIRLFLAGTWRPSTLVLAPLLSLPLFIWSTYIVDSALLRATIVNLFLAVAVVEMLLILWQRARRDGSIYWAPFFFLSLFLTVTLLRLGNWFLDPALRGLFNTSAANNTFFLIVLLHDIGIAVSYLMLHNKRRATDLLNTHRELRYLTENLQEQIRKETDRRLLQERLLAHNARLAALGEMLGTIAHQWRQPLSTLAMIIQHLDLLQRKGGLTQAEMTEARELGMGQIRHLSETIDEFRRFYLPDRQSEDFSPIGQFQSAQALLGSQLTAGNIAFTLRVNLPPDALIHGFPNQFKHAVLNLLTNAREAILERRRRDPDFSAGAITAAIDTDGSDCLVTISDNGCGIDPEVGELIFEPFYTSREPEGGTGIGLYLTRTIITDGFCGSLDFTSTVGATTFRLRIPLTTREDAP